MSTTTTQVRDLELLDDIMIDGEAWTVVDARIDYDESTDRRIVNRWVKIAGPEGMYGRTLFRWQDGKLQSVERINR